MAAMAQAAVTEGMKKGMEDQNMMERIRSAVSARSEHIKDHSDSLTMVSIRRLLEEDLGLEASALNAYKKQITQLVDQIMKPENQTEPEAEESKPKSTQETADVSDQKEPSDNIDLKEVEEPSEVNGSEAGDKDGSIGSPAASNSSEEKQKRTKAVKEKTKSGEQKKKIPESKPKSSKKRLPAKKLEVTDESEEEVSEGSAAPEEEAEKSDSPAKKPSKLQSKASKASDLKPVSNKLVEQLKQMIKSCGMSIPPSIYKRVKQAPENKRDSALVSELESILQKEGLNRHSSEKEIKAVKKNKDKQKDLEGIDVGNIITEGRPRRQQQADDFYDIPVVAAKAKRRRKAVVVSDDEKSDISKGSEAT